MYKLFTIASSYIRKKFRLSYFCKVFIIKTKQDTYVLIFIQIRCFRLEQTDFLTVLVVKFISYNAY